MKRQRGRGRRPGGGGHHGNYGGGGGGGGGHQNPNRTLESNGPETKVRGPAAVIFERYLQLARDAASSGDRVLSENYLQHADHYFRLVRAMQPAQPPPQPQNERYDNDMDGDEEGQESEGAEDGESFAEGGDQPDADFQQSQQQQQQDRGGEGEFRRRRGRRNRFRGEGEREGGEAREGGEPREGDGEPQRERAEGGERQRAEGGERPRTEGERSEGRRERRPPRERPDDQSGPEGFSSGPKPAFLRGGND